ncbi:hypothetical protein GCM10023097_62050 [Streptomyces collinus]
MQGPGTESSGAESDFGAARPRPNEEIRWLTDLVCIGAVLAEQVDEPANRSYLSRSGPAPASPVTATCRNR